MYLESLFTAIRVHPLFCTKNSLWFLVHDSSSLGVEMASSSDSSALGAIENGHSELSPRDSFEGNGLQEASEGVEETVRRLEEELGRTKAEKDTFEAQYRGLLGKLTQMRTTLGDKLKQDAVRSLYLLAVHLSSLRLFFNSNDRLNSTDGSRLSSTSKRPTKISQNQSKR